jgi:hypothetical protein
MLQQQQPQTVSAKQNSAIAAPRKTHKTTFKIVSGHISHKTVHKITHKTDRKISTKMETSDRTTGGGPVPKIGSKDSEASSNSNSSSEDGRLIAETAVVDMR